MLLLHQLYPVFPCSSLLHWLQWLHHRLLWPSDSLDLTFRHRVHLLFVSVNTVQGIWSMHRMSIGNTEQPVHLCRCSLEDIYTLNWQEPKSFFIQLWAAATMSEAQLCISWSSGLLVFNVPVLVGELASRMQCRLESRLCFVSASVTCDVVEAKRDFFICRI